MFLKYVCFLLVTFFSLGLFAQDLSISTLESLEDEELLTLFNEVEKDSIKAEKVARVYLNRARRQKDTIKMARGYDRLARIFHPQKNIQFADSIIFLTKNLKNITYPGLAYMQKAYNYNNLKKIIESFKNYLISYEYAVSNDNIAQQVYILQRISGAHFTWGDKNESLKFQKMIDFIIESDEYTNKIIKTNRKERKYTVESLAFSDKIGSFLNYCRNYTRLNKIDTAKFYLKKAALCINKYKKTNFKTNLNFYKQLLEVSELEILYFNKEYGNLIDLTDKEINFEMNNHSFEDFYFYKGMSHFSLQDEEKGIRFLLKADSIFDADKSTFLPYFLPTYQTLYQYYKKQGNAQEKLHYLNKLIQADSLIKTNYKFFEPSLVNTFETKLLLDEKESLIQSLQLQSLKKTKWVWFFLISFSLLVFSLLVYIKKQSTYKKRFLALTTSKLENTSHDASIKKSKLAKDIIIKILEGLEIFENQKEYLFSKITLTSLAKSLSTNKSYLSHTINLQKGKRFSDYINNLRVQYAFSLLKNTPIYRKYTIKAIAQECGFKSGESFSKSFYKNYGIYPSYYIKQLEQNKKKTA